MNRLQATLLALVLAGLVIHLVTPRRRGLGLLYYRYLALVLAAAVMLMPFYWLICAAFKDASVLMNTTFLPPLADWGPATLNLSNFRALFAPEETPQGTVFFWRYIVNSLFLAATATTIHIFFCSLSGFAIAKYQFRGKALITSVMLGSMMIPGMILLAPVYELVFRLGWMDTYWALLVPGAVPVFGVFLFRQAILAVPDQLIEAARVDGCTEFGIYWGLVMPLVRPMTAAFCLVSFLGSWNAFIGPQIYITTQARLTLPVVLSQYMGIYTQQYGVFLAGTLLSILPPAIMFFALQKEFVAGLTSGAVKG